MLKTLVNYFFPLPKEFVFAKIEVFDEPNERWELVKEIMGTEEDNLPARWSNIVKETTQMQEVSGNKHRAVTFDAGLRHIYSNGSFYWTV